MKGEQDTADLQCTLLRRVDRLKASLNQITPAVLEEEPESMPESPEHKVESHAVPQADHQHRGKLTDQNHCPGRDGFVAADPAIKGVEKIRANPACKGHVPAIPK